MAAPTLGVLTAAASRYLISQYNQIPTVTSITYNLTDMVVSAVAFKIFEKVDLFGITASRVLGCVVASLVTTALCGPIDLGVAMALNLTSFVVSLLMSMAARPHGEAPQLVFV